MRAALVVLMLLTPLVALSHGGGLNAEGCHMNRKTGDYHCHRAPSVQRDVPQRASPSSPSRLVPERQANPRSTPSADGSTCYIGPRGGTYTITPSGRKNYSGC